MVKLAYQTNYTPVTQYYTANLLPLAIGASYSSNGPERIKWLSYT